MASDSVVCSVSSILGASVVVAAEESWTAATLGSASANGLSLIGLVALLVGEDDSV